MRLYIDTSVINGLLVEDRLRIKEATQVFFRLAAKPPFVMHISELVAAEIKRTADIKLRGQLLNIVNEYAFEILPVTEEAQILSKEYIKEKIIPAKYLPDALHIATAVTHNIRVLVSWNFAHMVKHQTRIAVNATNLRLDYPQIDICSPEEV
ncbi:MAG: PIN domain-containing protein [Candidatus Omnitrophota bacterium]